MWERFKSLPSIYKAGSVFILLMLVAMLAAWYDHSPKPVPDVFTPAPPIKGTENIPKEGKKTATGGVTIIPKGPLGGKIDLPPEVKNDPKKEVTATAVAPPSETSTDIISVIDLTTGDTTISTKPQPQSFLAFENKKRIGVGYGISSEGNTGKVFGEWTFLRVANTHVGVQTELSATATKSPEAKAYAVIDYRW